MKNVFIFLFILSGSTYSFSQAQIIEKKQQKSSSIYVDGPIITSVNYERTLKRDTKVKSTVSIGLGISPFKRVGFNFHFKKYNSNDKYLMSVPVSYNLIFGNGHNHFEVGSGVNIIQRKSFNIYATDTAGHPIGSALAQNNTDIFLKVHAAYRFEKATGGLFFKAAITSMYKAFEREGNAQTVDGTIARAAQFNIFNTIKWNSFFAPSVACGYSF